MKDIYVYPSPETVNKVLFKDKADNCFIIQQENKICPKNKNEISNFPVQE